MHLSYFSISIESLYFECLVFVVVVFRQPRRSMTHVGNIFTYKSNVQHVDIDKDK